MSALLTGWVVALGVVVLLLLGCLIFLFRQVTVLRELVDNVTGQLRKVTDADRELSERLDAADARDKGRLSREEMGERDVAQLAVRISGVERSYERQQQQLSSAALHHRVAAPATDTERPAVPALEEAVDRDTTVVAVPERPVRDRREWDGAPLRFPVFEVTSASADDHLFRRHQHTAARAADGLRLSFVPLPEERGGVHFHTSQVRSCEVRADLGDLPSDLGLSDGDPHVLVAFDFAPEPRGPPVPTAAMWAPPPEQSTASVSDRRRYRPQPTQRLTVFVPHHHGVPHWLEALRRTLGDRFVGANPIDISSL